MTVPSRPVTTPVGLALLYSRDQLEPFPARCRADKLPEQFPPIVNQIRGSPEARCVDQITPLVPFEK
jgi:hypothetical protein